MSTLVKVQSRGQVTIPLGVRSRLGLESGGVVAIEAIGEKIVLTRHTGSDAADDEYTPAQRRAIDARLAVAERGPFFGPFKDGDEVAAFLKKQSAPRKKSTAKKPR